MIKLRIQGTADEVQEFINTVCLYLNVLECSSMYPNRGNSQYVRAYMDIGRDKPGNQANSNAYVKSASLDVRKSNIKNIKE